MTHIIKSLAFSTAIALTLTGCTEPHSSWETATPAKPIKPAPALRPLTKTELQKMEGQDLPRVAGPHAGVLQASIYNGTALTLRTLEIAIASGHEKPISVQRYYVRNQNIKPYTAQSINLDIMPIPEDRQYVWLVSWAEGYLRK